MTSICFIIVALARFVEMYGLKLRLSDVPEEKNATAMTTELNCLNITRSL
tara:strand:+ start:2107 stop:2256 length:150 start_codon:yes stop_codon:yes gene_type:complete